MSAAALGLVTRTFTSGSPATYLLHFALTEPKFSAHRKSVRDADDDEDDGGDWSKGGEGDAAKLALLAQILPEEKANLLRCEVVEVGVMFFAEKKEAAK